jgi:sigma-B regulation protein RsbU (phosphoserine phosphatase)
VTPPDLHLCLLSQPRLLGPVRAMLESYAERAGLDEAARAHLVLAVDEALANIIRHGYEHRCDCLIWVGLRTLESPPAVRVEIDDHQDAFDPESLPKRDLAEVRPGGLGLHLISELADDYRIEPRECGGMRVVIEKRLPAGTGSTPPSDAGSTR